MFMDQLFPSTLEIPINFSIKDLELCSWKKLKELLNKNMDLLKWLLFQVLELDIIIENLDISLKDLIWLKNFDNVKNV